MTNTILKTIQQSKHINSCNQVFLSDLDTSGFSPEMNAILQKNSESIQVFEIMYTSNGHLVHGFIIVPNVISEKVPAVIYNRGGNRDFGEIKKESLFRGLFLPVCLALHGYCVIMSNYSGSSKSEGIDEFGGNDLKDVLILKEILPELGFVDTENIGMAGGSRGGMMTYLALSKVTWLKAAVTTAGAANSVRQLIERPQMQTVFKELFGGAQEDLIARSAVYWPEKFCATTPLLMIHGTADWRVSPLDSIELAQKLYEHKKPYRLILYEGADHGISEFKREVNAEILKWFDRFLKNNEELPNLEPHGQ